MNEGECPMIDGSPSGTELADLIRSSLSSCSRRGSVISFPSLLISSAHGRLQALRSAGAKSADVAAGLFQQLGFRADRTRMNLYGYPGLFRDLAAPPPWAEMVPGDGEGPTPRNGECDGEGPTPRNGECDGEALYQLVSQFSSSELCARYRSHLDEGHGQRGEMSGPSDYAAIMEHQMAHFKDVLGLARCIGADWFQDVAEAVFLYDEFSPYPGAPDLLVWLADSHDGLWFFAEVKAPNDSLRGSQRAWLHANWERIRGRFVQVLLE
jgi:hypothetical protein